jgi:hypothetical protein
MLAWKQFDGKSPRSTAGYCATAGALGQIWNWRALRERLTNLGTASGIVLK